MFKNKITKIIVSLTIAFAVVFSITLPSFAAQPKVDTIDVSHWNRGNSGIPLSVFQTLKRGGIQGCIVKIADGNNYIDPSAKINFTNSKTAGIVTSGYAYVRPTSVSDAISEAKWFDKALKFVGFDKVKDGAVVIDLEESSLTKNKTLLTEYANAYINELYTLGYPLILLYSGNSFLQTRVNTSQLNIDPTKYWIARYSNGRYEPNWINGIKSAWQWSSNYHFSGISGNFDVTEDYAGWLTKYSSNATPVNTPGKIVSGTVKSVSLVNYLKSKKMDWSFNGRAKLAVKYGLVTSVNKYLGNSAQNLSLLSLVKKGVKPVAHPKAPTVKQRNSSQYLSKSTKKITTKKTVYLYKSTNFINKYRVAKFKSNTVFTITSSKLSANGILRFKTKSGLYITANKSYVQTYTAPKKAVKHVVKKVTHKTYTVKKGDTLYDIAKAKKLSLSTLLKLNHLKMISVIYPKQVLKLN